MVLRIATTAILLALFIQYVEGVIVANKSDDRDDRIVCCTYGNCSCASLYSALANLTSNSLINIMTDVELSSIISLVDLANIAITGHNNPTVDCNNSGGIHFISCYNCTIEGITWKRCGSKNIREDRNVYPVLHLFNSSNLTISNCSFQHSIGQSVVLLGVSGDVNIDNCDFLYNTLYESHGAAVYYTSNNTLTADLSVKFVINSCNFCHTESAQSIVFFGHHSVRISECLYVQNSKFHYNKGVPIYVYNQNLNINGKVEFYGNIAENGGGIAITDHSNVTFHKSTMIDFTNNSAMYNGGAVYLINHSNILFKDRSTLYHCQSNERHNILDNGHLTKSYITVLFYRNRAEEYGQHIYAHTNSNIIIGDTAEVTFTGITNHDYPTTGAVYVSHYSTVTFQGSSNITFNNNTADNGGAIRIDYYSSITFKANSEVMFNDNRAEYSGGALYIDHDSIMTTEESTNVVLSNNRAYKNSGGAMYIRNHSNIILKGNSMVTFNNNTAFSNGGAVHIDENSIIVLEGSSTATFNYNTVDANCGAIRINVDSYFESNHNSTINFNFNRAVNGGALCAHEHSNVTFKENSTVMFYHNIAHVSGGAVHIEFSSTVKIKGNSTSTVMFSGNIAGTDGGAVFLYHCSAIHFEETGTITLYNNTANQKGGALYIGYKCISESEENCILMFNYNMAELGGSVYIERSAEVFIGGNSSIEFINNTALRDGGAIYLNDHSFFTQCINSNVTFYYNTARDYGRAIYALIKGSSITFNSFEIHFKDNTAGTVQKSVYINVPKLCDSDCLFQSLNIPSNTFFPNCNFP